jgi:uncharacterized protein
MPSEVMHRAIDLAFAQGEGPVGIAFFGGEPLLRFAAIREAISLAREASDRTGRPVHFRMTTNGTLLHGERLDYLMREKVAVAVSLDGPPDVQDRQRPGPRGAGSHALVTRNLRALLKAMPTARVISVVPPGAASRVGDSLSHLVDLGVRGIHLAVDWGADWTAADLRRLRRGLGRAAGVWADSFRAGQPVAVTPFDGIVARTVMEGAARLPRCSCGEAEWTVAPSGRLYPCDRMVGQDDGTGLVIGTVFDGFDETAREGFRRARSATPARCARCRDAARCRFWAPCVREATGGWQAEPSLRLCRLERAFMMAVDDAAGSLYSEGNRPFLDRFYRSPAARSAAARHGVSINEVVP